MYFFFFNDTATTEIYTLSLHDALPIWIVVNNSILMVEFVEELRSEGMPAQQAVVEAGAGRMRPILMTTLTTLLGMLPLALGIGAGTEILQPLAGGGGWGPPLFPRLLPL